MPAPEVEPKPFWSFLWGKRRSRRHPLVLPARLEGPVLSSDVETVDLSRHGILLSLPTKALAPLGPGAEVVRLGLDCSPCFARECPYGHLRCLVDLEPDRVIRSL